MPPPRPPSSRLHRHCPASAPPLSSPVPEAPSTAPGPSLRSRSPLLPHARRPHDGAVDAGDAPAFRIIHHASGLSSRPPHLFRDPHTQQALSQHHLGLFTPSLQGSIPDMVRFSRVAAASYISIVSPNLRPRFQPPPRRHNVILATNLDSVSSALADTLALMLSLWGNAVRAVNHAI